MSIRVALSFRVPNRTAVAAVTVACDVAVADATDSVATVDDVDDVDEDVDAGGEVGEVGDVGDVDVDDNDGDGKGEEDPDDDDVLICSNVIALISLNSTNYIWITHHLLQQRGSNKHSTSQHRSAE